MRGARLIRSGGAAPVHRHRHARRVRPRKPTSEGEWVDWGLYRAEEFERQEDGAYLCAAEGSPLWLRCLRQDGSVIYVIDGGGDPFTYRLAPFPSEKYPGRT